MTSCTDDDRIRILEEENARLLALTQKEPHTAYLEAVQRACDDRMSEQKHRIRELEGAVQADERCIAWLKRLAENYRVGWVGAEDQLAALRNQHTVIDHEACARSEDVGSLKRQLAMRNHAVAGVERRAEAELQLAKARAALERIAGSRLNDFTTLHPESCSRVAQEALAALQDRVPAEEVARCAAIDALKEVLPMTYHLDAERARRIALDHAREGYVHLCETSVFAALDDARTECEARIKSLELRTEGAERETELAYGNMQEADRQLAEARAAIAGALNELEEARTGSNDPFPTESNDPFIVAAQERLRAVLKDRAPSERDGG